MILRRKAIAATGAGDPATAKPPTALDAAKGLRYASVAAFLAEKGTKPGAARPEVTADKPRR